MRSQRNKLLLKSLWRNDRQLQYHSIFTAFLDREIWQTTTDETMMSLKDTLLILSCAWSAFPRLSTCNITNTRYIGVWSDINSLEELVHTRIIAFVRIARVRVMFRPTKSIHVRYKKQHHVLRLMAWRLVRVWKKPVEHKSKRGYIRKAFFVSRPFVFWHHQLPSGESLKISGVDELLHKDLHCHSSFCMLRAIYAELTWLSSELSCLVLE